MQMFSNVNIFHYTAVKKITCINITTFSSEESLSIRELWVSQEEIQVFQNSNFHLKAQVFLTGNKYCQLFSLKWHFTWFKLEHVPANSQAWCPEQACQPSLGAHGVQGKQQLARPAASTPPPDSHGAHMQQKGRHLKYWKVRGSRVEIQ